MDDLISDVPFKKRGDFNKLRNVMTKLSSTRNGKTVSRIKAQLDGLREDNIIYKGRNMADIILDFINDEYAKTSLVPAYNMWRKFYTEALEPFRKAVTIPDLESAETSFSRYVQTTNLNTIVDLVVTDALILDTYLLARMFRRFTTQRHGREVHAESNTVITYAGAAHAARYALFFDKYLSITREDSVVNKLDIKNINRCLENPRFGNYFK